MEKTEYGIIYHTDQRELQRGPMTLKEALDWIDTWTKDGGKPDTFIIVKRTVIVGEWEYAD